MATSTNNLQRAAWACESAGQARSKPGTLNRFFLGLVENTPAQAAKPPLVLLGNQLSGAGQIANNHGWFNIRFGCMLRPDLMQATAFTFTVLSPVAPTDAPPPAAATPDAKQMRWYLAGATSLQLVHGNGQDHDFRAECVRSSRMVRIDLAHTLPGLQRGNFLTAGITDGPNSALYIAQTGSAGDTNFTLPTNDPLLDWIGKGATLHINLGGEYAYDVAQTESGEAIAAFLKACR